MIEMKKVLSFVLVLSMVLGSVSMAFATTSNTVAKQPTVAKGETIPGVAVTLEVVDAAGLDANTSSKIKLSIENGAWASSVDKTDLDNVVIEDVAAFTAKTDDATSASAVKIAQKLDGNAKEALDGLTTATAINKNSVEFSFESNDDMVKGDSFVLYLNIAAAKAAGEVKVNIESIDGIVSSGTYTVAIVGTDTTITKVVEDKVLTGRTTAGVTAAGIEIRETAINSIAADVHEFKLTLPKGVEWSDSITAANFGGDMLGSIDNVTPDGRDLFVTMTAVSANDVRQVLTITPVIEVYKEAKLGDIAVQLRSLEGPKNQTIADEVGLVIANYCEEGVSVYTVDEEDLPEIIAGREFADFDSEVYEVEVTLEEVQEGSLIENKYIDFTFPEYVHVLSNAAISVQIDGDEIDTITSNPDGEEDGNEFEWTVSDDVTDGEATAVTFVIPVTVEANAPAGDLELTVSGAKAGVDETKIVVGKIVTPITAEFKLSDVKTGVQNQAVADIIIKETAAGMLWEDGTIELNIYENGQGIDFNAAEVEVVASELEIKDIDIDDETGAVVITIDRHSIKTPAEIKVSGLEVTLNRTPAECKYELGIGGSALVDNGAYEAGLFSDDVICEDYINVVTPADQGVNATFKIGESKYTVNGVEVAMDAPSYVDDNNRTMVSIRYVANALGVSDNKIIWNEDAQTATIFGKSTVVVKIGENQITVNGSVIPMDTQAVNKAGRIYVPLRYIANALGAAVEWNQDAQTATIITLANN